MITASFVRAIERFAGDLCRHFLPLFQQVVAIRKTCNQLYGSEADGVAGLRSWRTDGLGDILAYPLLDPADRKGSLPRALAAMARAARQGP